jgi:hypothetical protein
MLGSISGETSLFHRWMVGDVADFPATVGTHPGHNDTYPSPVVMQGRLLVFFSCSMSLTLLTPLLVGLARGGQGRLSRRYSVYREWLHD